MRLFIASPLPVEIEEMLGKVIFDLKQKRGKVKWVAPKNIHLTLKFLGEVSEEKIEPIKGAIQTVASRHRQVESVIDKVGAFPDFRRPRVVWAGISGNIELLQNLAAEIESEMEKLGFEEEKREFRSHLTLGRVKDSSSVGELAEAIKVYEIGPESVTFESLVLFKSTLTPQGPIYDRLFEAELKK
jgi:2'-5' RNA ligase